MRATFASVIVLVSLSAAICVIVAYYKISEPFPMQIYNVACTPPERVVLVLEPIPNDWLGSIKGTWECAVVRSH